MEKVALLYQKPGFSEFFDFMRLVTLLFVSLLFLVPQVRSLQAPECPSLRPSVICSRGFAWRLWLLLLLLRLCEILSMCGVCGGEGLPNGEMS